ncbi:MAG: peptidyl-prolyl cis-trans isomerase [Deltaproteobacteria bacterium]|nr:peptidyl-prolyl cis-trans isomerase [Deltaproteobacteria bacterium]
MHRTDWPLGILLTAALALCACGGPASEGASGAKGSLATAPAPTLPNPEVIGETLGTVNGMPIGSNEFDQLASRRGRDVAVDEAGRQEILDRLVEEKLLYQEALRQGIDQDPKIQRMMVNTLLKQDVYSSVKTSDITDDALQAYFDEHKEEFVVPEKAQVKRILIAPEGEANATPDAWSAAEQEALAVRAKVLERKADFRKLAQDQSSGAYARRGGDLGFVTQEGKPGIPKEVIETAFGLEKGGVSEPFKTTQGWNIVYVPNKRDRVERTFDQMRGSVLRKVKSDTYKSLYDGYVSELRAGATVEIDSAKLNAHEVSSPKRPTLSAPGDEPEELSGSGEE